MTYCIGMLVNDGLLCMADSRTNSGVDHISVFRKLHIFQDDHKRRIILMSAGNLATTQSVIQLLRQHAEENEKGIMTMDSMYDVALAVGRTVRQVIARDSLGQPDAEHGGVDYSCSMLVGGQIGAEQPRLFNIYSEGNFIEATTDTPFFQIGESKYGRPIIDRLLKPNTNMVDALKCALLSFDSTMKSNVSVAAPLDLFIHYTNEYTQRHCERFDEDHPYLELLREHWERGLGEVFRAIPAPPLLAEHQSQRLNT